MLAHDNVVASIETFHRIVPPMEHRIVSLLPLSHLLEQAVGLFYALSVGADILYVRSRNPRVIFDALRDHRVTSMVVVPQVLDLFWTRHRARGRQARPRDRVRPVARDRPPPADVAGGRACSAASTSSSAAISGCSCRPGAFLPPALQQAWEDLGVTVLQGYGATETGTGSSTPLDDHGLGTVGRPPAGVEMRIAEGGEIQFKGPTVFRGYWQNPTATAEAFTDDGWYRTGDIGHLDPEGRLILSGRIKDIIVLPNGFNVYPEDIENALRIAGIRDSVVLETQPGRIEAVVLGSSTGRRAAPAAQPRRTRRPCATGSTPRSRRPTPRSARTSGSPAGDSGPRRTSRGPTRSRSSARRSAPGSPSSRRCRCAGGLVRDREARPRASRARSGSRPPRDPCAAPGSHW